MMSKQNGTTKRKRSTKADAAREANDRAVQLHLSGNFAEALDAYGEAIALNPKNATAHNNLGFLLAQAGRWRDAIEHLARAVTLDPDHAGAHGNLGQALAAVGNVDGARQHLETAVTLAPESAQAWDNMGRVRLLLGDAVGAADAWRMALEAEPENPQLLVRLATALSLQDRHDEAVDILGVATTLAPGHAPAWTQLGVILYIRRDLSQARAALRTALGLDRKDTVALRHLGLVELAFGDRLAAGRAFREVLEADPDAAETRLDLAVLCLSVGAAAEALQHIERLTESGGAASDRLRFYHGLALRELGRDRQGNRVLKEVTEEGGDYAARARDLLARPAA